MRRRKAIKNIALGLGGFGLLSRCTSPSALPSLLGEKDKQIVSLLTEAILPIKSEDFPTPETRIEFIFNQT